MQSLRRDLLLMRKEVNPDPKLIEREVTSLDQLLKAAESSEKFFVCYELLDLNKFKVLRDKLSISKAMKPAGLKPFQFLVNRN
ncbi:MAG: hypothetical protein ACK5EP_03820 [Bacteroidota bacterium]|jgi:hypothetical protein